MKYVIYIRVSTEEQTKGHSFETQTEICKAFMPPESEYEIILDSSSGGKVLEKRTQLQKALDLLEKGDILLVYKMDRLVRDYIQYGHLMYMIQAKKAGVIAVMEKDQDRTMKGFTAIISDLERQRIKDNTRNALRARKRAGFRVGRIPYGYQVASDKKVVRNQTEYQVLQEMEKLAAQGKSQREIASVLNVDGKLNREQKPWSHVSIHKILKNAPAHREAY
jgi:DNA invertase Pin-like site-specific DNA recombinase